MGLLKNATFRQTTYTKVTVVVTVRVTRLEADVGAK